ncbi:MAG: phosphatidate cytidylyltransferase [Thermoanaerobacteraceae bacterium]|nr:phosphatidate cytidylyltransferase [Thermoanaerobacteraceae bacterium]
MFTRIISAVVGIILLGYTINTGGWLFFASISILNICALYEMYNAFTKKNIYISFFLSSALTVVLLYFVSFNTFNFILTYLFLILLLMSEFLYCIINNKHKQLKDIVFSIFSFVYTSFLFMSMILVRNQKTGINLTWWIFITTWACDTGAFFSGLLLGKTPLAPTISPNKTLEGSIGGILSSVAASILFTVYFLPEINTIHAAFFGICIGIFSQVGDLSASLIKRYCKIKDFSNIIPGHGGVLDRLDSALFSFPVAYIFIKILLQKGGLP